MTPEQAANALEDAEVVPCLRAPFGEAKEILGACLEADIPALLDRGECCGKSGCGCAPKMELLVRPDDAPRVADLMQGRWVELAQREGLLDEDGRIVAAPTDAAGDEPPCPACGTAGPLVDGACRECGLQLG